MYIYTCNNNNNTNNLVEGRSGRRAQRVQGGNLRLHLFLVRRFHSARKSSLSVTVMFMSRRPLTL